MVKTSSIKAKGRRLQQLVRDRIREKFNLQEDDVRSLTMGESGEDILLSPSARQVFPFSVECKNVEKLNFWKAYEQAVYNSKGYTPLLVAKKNHSNPLVVLSLDDFMRLL